jgi:cyclic pyranopterin phosphate synthase
MPLLDGFDRLHTNLRISVTDRCNIRCFYCMPAENVRFRPKNEILTFEEIIRFTRVAVQSGISKLRLTGGEPLVRHHLPDLVRPLVCMPGVEDVALTTNGILLREQAAPLKRAGLHRLNISLDALSQAVFEKIARRPGLDQVLDGIQAAIEAGFERIRLNAVSIRGLTEGEIVPLARFARQHGLELRFIEYMPLDADGQWRHDAVLSGDEVRSILADEIAELAPVGDQDPSQPATDYEYRDGGGRVGFINSVTQPFCSTCDRLRLTAEGQIRNCLFSTVEWDARQVMRSGGSDEQLADTLRACVAAKKAGHGIDSADFVRPERAMYQIGG